jgi:hypothetical protein
MKTKLALMTCALITTVACNSNNRANRSVTDTATNPRSGSVSGTTSATTTDTATTDTSSMNSAKSLDTTNSKTAPASTASESTIGKGIGNGNEGVAAGDSASTSKVARSNTHLASGHHKVAAISEKMIEGKNFAVINFAKGSSELTDASKSKLRSMINSARGANDDNGRIQALHAAVWSDHTFPAGGKADLSKGDRDLADQRIDSINSFFKSDLNLSDIKTYSMAEKSNWFARAFSTKDAELKSLFAQKGAPSDVRANEFRAVKSHGGPSKAVILLDLKNQMKGNSASLGRRMNHRSDTVSGTTTSRSRTTGTTSGATTGMSNDTSVNHAVTQPTTMSARHPHASAEGMHAPSRDTGTNATAPNTIDRQNNGDQGATTDSSRAKLDDLSSERQ